MKPGKPNGRPGAGEPGEFPAKHRAIAVLFVLQAMLSFGAASPAHSQEQQQEQQPDAPRAGIRLLSPAENATVAMKKPRIRIAVDAPYSREGLLVMLDSTDITGMLDATPEGFDYAPPQVMMPGPHTLTVRLITREGAEEQQQFAFAVRHGETFEAAYSDNELTLLVEELVKRPAGAESLPESKVEGNLRSDTRLATAGAMVSVSANLRYLNQSAPVLEPQKKGVLDAANWVVNGAYAKDRFRLDAAVGDIMVEQTPSTITAFARRGGKAGIDFDDRYHLDLFNVFGRQVIGFREGAGMGADAGHISGVSAGIKVLDKRVELKVVSAGGETKDASFAVYPATDVMQKGEVTGLVLITDFFDGRFRTEFEGDSSTYDSDISDEVGARTDRAYRAKAGGFVSRYTYEALFERVGRDYAVIGNPWPQKDKEGASLRGGANLDGHGINAIVSQYHDNVRNDDLFPRIVNGQGAVDYQFSKIQDFTLGLSYQASRQRSEKEPGGAIPVELHSDGVSGRIGYRRNNLSFGFQAVVSRMNDLTEANRDSRSVTYTLTPAYNAPGLSVNPVLSVNTATDLATAVTSDTTTCNLDLRSMFLGGRASFDLGGTYTIMKTDDGLMDLRALNAAFRVAYDFREWFRDYLRPSLALRGSQTETSDAVTGARKKETTLFLVLATAMPFSL